MTVVSLPQRISDFLAQRRDRMYCDTCIQERLGLKWRQQVQLVTATLAVTAAFRRQFGKCCTCGEIKQVTHALNIYNYAPARNAVQKVRLRQGNVGQSRVNPDRYVDLDAPLEEEMNGPPASLSARDRTRGARDTG